MRNPFKPSFGTSPPLLVGREDLIEQFAEGLDDGPGSTARATIYTGARGVGKTVTLNEVESKARERGWLVISETATPGFVARIANQHLPQLLAQYDPAATRHHLTGVTAPLGAGGANWSTLDAHLPAMELRNQIALLTELLAAGETGLLITLDELHRPETGEGTDIVDTHADGVS